MAILLRSKNFLPSRLKFLTWFQRYNHAFGEGGFQTQSDFEMAPAPYRALNSIDKSKWKKIKAGKLGISGSMICNSTWIVLNTLHREGFEAYLVGGCVRDLLLKRIPKDFDIITTANLKQVKKQFHRAQIVGQRFPICLVHLKHSIIEVSSFETVVKHDEDKEKALSFLVPNGCDESDLIRWRNSMNRDFTINSLFFDPFTFNVYDYNNGISDLNSLKLRTLIPAHVSFQEDCARILRGLRIAARLGLSFSKDTESAMYDLSSSIEGLDKFRLMLELNYMLSYGAAESSIYLLQQFDVLSILLPLQAAYINQQRSAQNSMMLMKLFFNMDKLVSCAHPAGSSLWIGLLMFHLALINNPQDALVVWTFASVLYHGRWNEGVKFARKHTEAGVKFVPEISGFSETKSDEDLAKEVSRFASLVQDSVCALVDTGSLFESMSRYPFSPCSGLVFVSKTAGRDTAKFFHRMVNDIESFTNGRPEERFSINYSLLAKGDPHETRFGLGKIILETLKGDIFGEGMGIADGKKDPLPPKEAEKNLSNSQPPLKKDKKRTPSFLNPEAKRRMLKQNLVDEDQNHCEKHTATKTQELIAKEESESKDLAKTLKSSEEETNSRGNMLEKEKSHSPNQEIAVMKEETDMTNNNKMKGMKDLKVSNKQRKIIGKYDRIKWQNLLGLEKSKEGVKEKTEKSESFAVNGKGSRRSLSSLFK